MRTFDKKSPIPAAAAAGRIDIRYGGNVAQVERESVAVAEAYISTLEMNRSVLYLNTLSPDLEMSGKIGDARRRLRSDIRAERFKYMSMEPDEIYDRRAMITEMVEELRIRVIIINSFDFASMTRRGRRRIFQILKFLRDFMRMHIILYTRHEPKPSMLGVYGELAWLAETVSSLDTQVLTAVKRTRNVEGTETHVTNDGVKTVPVLRELEYLEVELANAERNVAETTPTNRTNVAPWPVDEAQLSYREDPVARELRRLRPDLAEATNPKAGSDDTASPGADANVPIDTDGDIFVDTDGNVMTDDDNNVLLETKELTGANVTPTTRFPEWAEQDYPDEDDPDYEEELKWKNYGGPFGE